jgi:hypothetical protein
MQLANLWLFVPLCALLDRAWGGGFTWRPFNVGLGKPLSLLMFPAALFCGFAWPAALALTIAWVVWRSPSWHTFGGDLAPHRERYLGTFLRHCLAPLGFGLAGCYIVQGFEVRQLFYLIFPVVATLLAIWTRQQSDQGEDVTPQCELIRGAVLGSLIWAVWSAYPFQG